MSLNDPVSKKAALRIGEKVRRLRNSRGLTQRELAGNSVSRNMMSMIESGAALPSLDTLLHISEILGVPAGYFFAEGDEEILYGKREAVHTVISLMEEKKFQAAAEICSSFAEGDTEMRLYMSLCRLYCGIEFLNKFMLGSAGEHFSVAAGISKDIPFIGGYIESVCDFVLILCDSVNKENVPESLTDAGRHANSIIPASYTAYLAAYKALKDGDTDCAAAISRSGLLGGFHSLHIKGAVLMASGDHEGATRLFDLALSSEDGGFYSRYKLICDLELCRRDVGDYESAYALSTSRMEMLGMFSK